MVISQRDFELGRRGRSFDVSIYNRDQEPLLIESGRRGSSPAFPALQRSPRTTNGGAFAPLLLAGGEKSGLVFYAK